MNLVEKLLKADTKKVEELETKVIKSKRLAKILGEKNPIDITIQEIPARRFNEILGLQFDNKGNFKIEKTFDAKALAVCEGVVDPPIKDKELMSYFRCSTPKDLVIKLFGSELSSISDEITILSGIDSDGEEEIKN